MEIYDREVAQRLVAYFKKRLGMYDYKNGWLKGDCPWCGKEDKFGIHIGKNKTNCFVCNEKVKPLDLILELEGLPTRKEVFNFVRNLTDIDPFESHLVKFEEKPVVLPESFRLLSEGEGMVAQQARKYIKLRGFDPEKLALKGVGYCYKGKYSGCIVFPFFTQGKLVYLLGRKMFASDAKFRNPEFEEYGIGKGQIIYNQDALYYYRRVQLMESYLNAETYGDTATATLGKIVTPYQKSVFLRSPVKAIDIVLDPDAWKESLKLAMDFSHYKEVRIIRLPEGKDVNDIGRKETKKLIKAESPKTYRQLYQMWLFENEKEKYDLQNA